MPTSPKEKHPPPTKAKRVHAKKCDQNQYITKYCGKEVRMKDTKIITTEMELHNAASYAAVILCDDEEFKDTDDEQLMRFAAAVMVMVCGHLTGEREFSQEAYEKNKEILEECRMEIQNSMGETP